MNHEHKNALRILRSFPFLLGVSVLISSLSYVLFDIFYLYGDDYLLNYLANGSFGWTYSAHLIYMRYPLGLILSGLFRLVPSINWYAWLLIGSIALSFGVFHWAVLKTSDRFFGLFFTLLANAAAVPLFLTFTVAGFLTAAAGFVFILLAFRKNGSPASFLPGVLLLALSFMLRSDCLLPTAGLAFPVFVKLLFPENPVFSRHGLRNAGRIFLKMIRQAILPAALFVLIAAGTYAAERAAESTPGWKAYYEFNDARGDYLDNPEVSYETFPGEFAEAGLTSEGWHLLHRWTFAEQETFSPEKLHEFAGIARRAYTKKYRLKTLIDTFKSSPNCFLILIPGLVLALLILLDSTRSTAAVSRVSAPRVRGHYYRRTGVFTFLMLLILFVFLSAIRLRFLLRVGVPLAVADILFLFLCAETRESCEDSAVQADSAMQTDSAVQTDSAMQVDSAVQTDSAVQADSAAGPAFRTKKAVSRIAALIAFAALLLSLAFFFRGYQSSVASLRSRKTAAGYAKLRSEIEKHPDLVYIVESPIYVHLFAWGHTVDEICPTDIFSHVIRPGSWDNFSPRYYEIADQCQIRDPDNLLSSMIGDGHVRFVTEDVNYVLNFLNAEGKGPVFISKKKQRGPANIVSLTH